MRINQERNQNQIKGHRKITITIHDGHPWKRHGTTISFAHFETSSLFENFTRDQVHNVQISRTTFANSSNLIIRSMGNEQGTTTIGCN